MDIIEVTLDSLKQFQKRGEITMLIVALATLIALPGLMLIGYAYEYITKK